MIDIFTQLKTSQKLSHNEKIVANYILEHPQQVIGMNTNQLKDVCFVSTATIYRLCEKLGIAGFSELKVHISSSLKEYIHNKEEFNYDFPIKKYQTHYEILNKIKEDYENTLTTTLNFFDLENLKHAVFALKKAKYIDIYSSAGNIYFAQNFQFQMQEIGVSVNVPIEEYHQRLLASQSDKDHLAIIITFGGRGLLSNIIPQILSERKTPILLISSYDYQPKYATPYYHLYINPYENHYNKISSFSTKLSILYILDVLYTCYFNLDYDNNKEKKLNYYSLIEKTNFK
jgi:Transcriptional regulators